MKLMPSDAPTESSFSYLSALHEVRPARINIHVFKYLYRSLAALERTAFRGLTPGSPPLS
jgi:hypothetical protein